MNNGVLDTIRKRRTIRRFTDKKISDEQIETLLEAAMSAPNRLNRQPWHFLVIRNKELQKNLADFLGLHPYLEEAPVLIAAAARPELSTTWMMDVSAAIENMLIAATAAGLGTAWIGEPDSVLWTMAEEMLRDALHIPTQLGVRIPALIAVGYPAQERPPHGRNDRLDPTRVHYGVWEGRRLGGRA
ncbi:MAG: nitroreductase family protein [Anaerolineae bacterium]|jgi:nitroreductase